MKWLGKPKRIKLQRRTFGRIEKTGECFVIIWSVLKEMPVMEDGDDDAFITMMIRNQCGDLRLVGRIVYKLILINGL
jgi:hypothetical protein